jgi:hypothetical protein
MIQEAYRIKAGGPGWLDGNRYDMQAKARLKPRSLQARTNSIMMLMNRLNLKFHREKRDMPMCALTVDKDRSKSKLTPKEAPNAGDLWSSRGICRLDFPRAGKSNGEDPDTSDPHDLCGRQAASGSGVESAKRPRGCDRHRPRGKANGELI